MRQITSVSELYKACNEEEPVEFFIFLGNGIRSSKNILILDNGKLSVVNEIDDSEQELDETTLHTQSHIGEAITKGKFYAY